MANFDILVVASGKRTRKPSSTNDWSFQNITLTDAGIDASKPLKLDGSKNFISGAIDLATEITGTLPIANGGTGGTGSLNNNRVMISNSDAIVEATAITANMALISDANGIPVAHSDVSSTELGYINGVTSNIQTQLNTLSSGYNRRAKVLDYIVDNTQAPLTEVDGDRYILSHDGGTPHIDYDGASANDIVEFVTDTWVATTPAEGWVVYDDDSNYDYLFIDDGTGQWEQRAVTSTSLADGKVWIGNVSNEAAEQTLTGDVTISNGGVTAIGSGVIVDADVKSDAAIVESKLSLDYATGTLNTAIGDHTSDTDNPHSVVLSDVVAGTLVANADVAADAAIAESKLSLDYATGTLNTAIGDHTSDTDNPHSVVLADVVAGTLVADADIASDASITASKLNLGDGVKSVSNALVVDYTDSFVNANAGAITVRQAIYVKVDGEVDLAKADVSGIEVQKIGFVSDASITASEAGLIFVREGALVTGFSGLTPGSICYVDRSTAGAITQSVAGFTTGEVLYPIGHAISATEVIYKPGDPIVY